MIAVSYIMNWKIKKIFYEVISNSKNFNIIFFQRNCQRPRFSQTYRGTRLKEDWTTSNMVISIDKYQNSINLHPIISFGIKSILKMQINI